ncbi:MAG: hypothetical protein JO185_03840 [Acidobacteriaceae bacterium]|nr:hypothetical protein [Acidobacteriaceae bacterium]
MPSNHGLGLHHEEGLGPARPQMTQGNPKDPISSPKLRSWLLPFEHRQLLSKSHSLQSKPVTRQEESAQVSEHSEQE